VIDNGQTSSSAKRVLAQDHLKYNNQKNQSVEQHPPVPDVLTGEYAKCFQAACLMPVLGRSDFFPPQYIYKQRED